MRPVDDAAKAKSRINMRLVASAFARRQKPMVIQDTQRTSYKKFPEPSETNYLMYSTPPIYGTRAVGILMLPSGC